MEYLVFQLVGAMASWGEAAVGEYRGTLDVPTASAISGLLCAALGLRRDQEDAIQAVHHGYWLAVGAYDSGPALRDYHTAQVPSRSMMKGQRHATRKDELAFPRGQLNTILSTRDYLQDVDYLAVLQADPHAPYPLTDLRSALLNPAFIPYLGRKACPLGAPLAPRIVEATHVVAAMSGYPRGISGECASPSKLAWSEGMALDVQHYVTVRQRDRLIHRGAWQYGERQLHIAMLTHKV